MRNFMKTAAVVGFLIAGLLADVPSDAYAAGINSTVAVCDPHNPLNCLAPSSSGGFSAQVQGTVADGVGTANNPVVVGGRDRFTGNNVRAINTDPNGNVFVVGPNIGSSGLLPSSSFFATGGTDGTNGHIFNTDTAGNQLQVGNVASGVADAGNPVKTGCVFNTTLPTPTTGQRVDCQAVNNGIPREIQFVVNTALADGVSNTSFLIAGASTTGVPGGTSIQVFPLWYNGATWDRQFTCPLSAQATVTAGTTTQLVALVAAQQVRVCSFTIDATLAGTAQFVYGTGANCVTGTTALTPAMPLLASTPWAMQGGSGSIFRTISANELCLAAVTGNMNVIVTYAQF